MRISHKHKFILFSFPKTGSESLREMLDLYSDVKDVSFNDVTLDNPFYSHISPREMKLLFEKFNWDFDSYTKIVCVRNPYNRLVSIYEMIYRNYPIKPPFQLWLKTIRNDGKGGGGKPHEKWRQYGTYSLINFISSENNEILVDRIIKLEDFELEIPKLFEDLKLPLDSQFKIIKKNKGKIKKRIADYYNKKSIDFVKRQYYWELEKFNYRLLQ